MRRPLWIAAFAVLLFSSAPAQAVTTGNMAVGELGLSCYNGSRSGWFLEIKNFVFSAYPLNYGLRITDASGAVLYFSPNVFAGRTGTSWPIGRTFLIAGSGFASTCGVTPDLVLTELPDTLAGTVELMTTNGVIPNTIFETVDYGSGRAFPAPAHARTLGRTLANTDLVLGEVATPTNAAGATSNGNSCYFSPITFLGGHLQQLAAGTTQAGPGSAYVLVTAYPGATWPAHMALEIKDHTGAVTMVAHELDAAHAGQAMPASGAVLVGGPDFSSATGLEADAIAPLAFDSLGGSIRLYLEAPGGAGEYTADSHAWTAGMMPVNGVRDYPAGSALGVLSYGTTAKNRAGQAMSFPNAYGDPAAQSLVVRQMMFACADGDTGVRFLELGSFLNPATLSPSVHLRTRAADGALLADVAPFGSRTGQTMTPVSTRAWLLAPRELAWRAGVTPDGPAPPLDPAGGWVVLCMVNAQGDSIGPIVSHAYGSAGGLTLPPPGASIWRKSSSVTLTTMPPTLHTFGGATARLLDCSSCAEALVASGPAYLTPGTSSFVGNEDTLSVTSYSSGTISTTTTANLRAGTLRMQGNAYHDFTSEALLRLDLEPGGTPLGTAMPVTIDLDYVLSADFSGPPPQLISGECHLTVKLASLTTPGLQDSLDIPLVCNDLTGTLHLPITLTSGSLHRVSAQLYNGFRLLTAVEPATFDYRVALGVTGLPEGAWVRSCTAFERGTGSPPPLSAPAGGSPLALAILGTQPVRGALVCEFAMPRAGAARLALYDVVGRRLASREVQMPAAGRASLELAKAGTLPPGLYLVRLESADGTRARRALVIR